MLAADAPVVLEHLIPSSRPCSTGGA